MKCLSHYDRKRTSRVQNVMHKLLGDVEGELGVEQRFRGMLAEKERKVEMEDMLEIQVVQMDTIKVKRPAKRTQYFKETSCKILARNVLHALSHPAEKCCKMLQDVGWC